MSEEPPTLPQRPKSPFAKQIEELQEAFPDVDTNVRRAILVAAGGNLENAFNGLLALSDDTIRPPPPQEEIINRQQQLRNDEELARRIAHGSRRSRDQQQQQHPRGAAQPQPQEDQDDLSIDEIRENIQKWGNEASKNIGSFFNNLKTRIQTEFQPEEPDEDYYGRVDPLNRGTSRADAYRQVQTSRRSDSPHFVEMNEDQPPAPPPKPTRPGATIDKQKVNVFGEDKPARWEPLRSTAESDAFFIGESDEEVDSLDEDTPLASRGNSKSEAKRESKDDVKDESKEAKSEVKDTKVDEEIKSTGTKTGDKSEAQLEMKEAEGRSEEESTKDASKDSKSAKASKSKLSSPKPEKTESASKESKDSQLSK